MKNLCDAVHTRFFNRTNVRPAFAFRPTPYLTNVRSMKPLNQRLGKVALILLVPLAAFQLGRYSESFSGTALAWAVVAGNILLLVLLLFVPIRDAWKDRE